MSDYLHARLRAEVERRMAVARAAPSLMDSRWEVVPSAVRGRADVRDAGGEALVAWELIDRDAAHIALNDPADAILAGEWALSVLERHIDDGDGDCSVCFKPPYQDDYGRDRHGGYITFVDCPELLAMAKRYGLEIE
jgi:hypothetical protein